MLFKNRRFLYNCLVEHIKKTTKFLAGYLFGFNLLKKDFSIYIICDKQYIPFRKHIDNFSAHFIY